ncbi:LysR family transcriptional regulator ArgP [Pontibacterium granulatum]|uniref:LysR family transcriptional regulator ArgP n=1 Tax=Pontibacterium granulatum TaxID=2036029 RepID=UPI00249B6902|nr:LysR family transcriptional regulator ArgP [Pontibacterium granulatum]MDI3326655.1 LysR family transcriptional regulator ArgP [Pontibacterium granulatum]
MLDLRQMAALAAIIEEQSFEKAARKLHITQSAVSQRLRQLEERLGQTLVVRSNPIQATRAGQQALKYFRQVSMLQNELMDELSLEQESGFTKVAIGVNADSLETWFLDALTPLLDARKLLLDLKVDDQDQTHHLLRTGEVLGCISASPEAMQGCSCIPLGVMPYRCLASPDYLMRYFPDGVNAEGFTRAPVAEFNNKDELQNRYLDKFFSVAAGDYPRHRIPSSETFFDLIVRGYACGMVPDQQSLPMIEAGRVMDMTPGRYLAIPLYWHVWNLKSDLAKELTEQLISAAEEKLDCFADHPELTHPG